MYGLWATNYLLSQYSNMNDHSCLCCNKLYEDSDYIYQYQLISSKENMASNLNGLQTAVQHFKFSSPLILAIKTGIQQWANRHEPTPPASFNNQNKNIERLVSIVFTAQSNLGWNQCL